MRGSALRVGLVCPYSFDAPGGVQNHVLGLAGWLGEQGHEVRVLAPGRVPAGPGAARGSAHRLDIASTGPARAVRYNGSVARVGLGPGVERRTARWLDEADLDLVHLHEPLTPGASLLALRHSRVPVVATFHTATPRSRAMQLAGRVLASSLDRIGAGIAVSEAARRVVVEHLGLDATVIGNGFTAPRLLAPSTTTPAPQDAPWCPTGGTRPGGAAGQRARAPRLAFLGRLDERRKGLDVLVRAWPQIRERWPRAQVVVAGAGSARLPVGWTSLGRVSDADRTRLLGWCDVFVAPHRGRESFGLVLLEALAAGARVVAADLPAFVDVVGDAEGVQAELFARGDPTDLVRALTTTLSADLAEGDGTGTAVEGSRLDPARRRRVVQLCSRFDWSVVGEQVLEVYRDLLGVGLDDPVRVAPTPDTSPADVAQGA